MKRQTQHRPPRDQKLINKQLSELKRENQGLKRKISRLQKYLMKALENQVPREDPEPDPRENLAAQAPGCPNCGDPGITHITIPGGVLMACRCGWRKKK